MLQLTRLDSLEDYRCFRAASAETLSRRAAEENDAVLPGELFQVPGHCWVCSRATAFDVRFTRPERERQAAPNWREHLRCPYCLLNARLRASLHISAEFSALPSQGSIYVTEQRSPFFRALRRKCPDVTGSEFLGDSFGPGQRNWRGIRHEDLSRLSFSDQSFDAILCFEVLEHIDFYRAALGECLRCLKSSGALVLTAPFVVSSAVNLRRAKRQEDGTVVHLLPPEYHTDPLRRAPVLCYHHFGWELLDEMKSVGFRDPHVLLYWSRHFGYLGPDSTLIMASKR